MTEGYITGGILIAYLVGVNYLCKHAMDILQRSNGDLENEIEEENCLIENGE